MSSQDLVAVGTIVGWFGVKGYCKLKAYSDTPDDIADAHTIHVGLSEGATVEVEIEDVIVNQRGLLVKFKGVDSRTAAEQYKNKLLFRPVSELPNLTGNKIYIHDIIGCDVESEEGETLGVVQEVYKMPGHDQWEIKGKTKTFLLPAVKEFVKKIDKKQRKITIRLIEGLIDGQ